MHPRTTPPTTKTTVCDGAWFWDHVLFPGLQRRWVAPPALLAHHLWPHKHYWWCNGCIDLKLMSETANLSAAAAYMCLRRRLRVVAGWFHCCRWRWLARSGVAWPHAWCPATCTVVGAPTTSSSHQVSCPHPPPRRVPFRPPFPCSCLSSPTTVWCPACVQSHRFHAPAKPRTDCYVAMDASACCQAGNSSTVAM